jgi:glycosyltransferase involved in cell wall biosynthesis
VTVAIVIPAFNEAKTIGQVVGGVASLGTVIVVDDASSDETADNATNAGAIVVRHNTNAGYDGAIESGFAEADRLGATGVITFDADGQHDPSFLGAFVEALEGDVADLVIGIRPKAARWSEALFGGYTRMRYGVPDILCGMKGYRIELYLNNGRFDGSHSIGTELAMFGLRTHVRVLSLPVPVSPRADKPRFGSALRSNFVIAAALGRAIVADLAPVTRSKETNPH